MDAKTVILGFFIALGFSLWPVVGKYSGAPKGVIITLVAIGTLVAAIALSAKEVQAVPAAGAKVIVLLLVAGAMYGLSCWLYAGKIAEMDSRMLPAFAAVALIGIMVETPILNWAINGSLPTMDHLIGFVLTGCGIYFLVK